MCAIMWDSEKKTRPQIKYMQFVSLRDCNMTLLCSCEPRLPLSNVIRDAPRMLQIVKSLIFNQLPDSLLLIVILLLFVDYIHLDGQI